MTIGAEIWVGLAGFGAAMMNAIAGGGTMLTFPALLAAGLPPVLANTTSTVALGVGMPGGVWAFRKHLPAVSGWIWPLGVASVVGGVAGGVLLLALPSGVFEAVVPWLLLLATALFVLNEPLVRWLNRRQAMAAARGGEPAAADANRAVGEPVAPRPWGVAFQVLVGLYGGYFGAGIGIMMLAGLGLLGLREINRLNALKALLALLVNSASIVYFIARGQVEWPLACWLMAGSIPGSIVGARLAQRIPARWVRLIAAVIGVSIAVSFWVK
jgi:uncharacterized membrane protein YfcA